VRNGKSDLVVQVGVGNENLSVSLKCFQKTLCMRCI